LDAPPASAAVTRTHAVIPMNFLMLKAEHSSLSIRKDS
jgi:hypothetical protein